MLPVAYGEFAMSSTQVQLRYNRFKEGLEDINYDACPGRLEHDNNRWKHSSSEINDFG